MDAEGVVAHRLMAATGIPSFVEMPDGEHDPGDLLCVEQVGGGGGYMEPVQLDVDCWSTREGGGRKRAKELAGLVKAAVPGLEDEPNIFHPVVTNQYRMADPDTRRPRYVVQVELWVCE